MRFNSLGGLTIKRLLTGVIALPLLIFFLLKANVPLFAGFISLLAFLGLHEYLGMALPERKLERFAAVPFGGALPLLLLAEDHFFLFFAALTLLVLFFGLIFLFRIQDMKKVGGDLALLLTGFCYVPLLLSHFILLRQLPSGLSWIFLLIVVVMCGDTFAFYVGSSLGKNRLYPEVSPKKSVEGAVGGLAGSVIGALVAKATFFPEIGIVPCVIVALLLGVLGQLGDLFESLLKRSFGVKDSGTIVPGHGGILDRLDSMLFAAPAAFYCARFLFCIP